MDPVTAILCGLGAVMVGSLGGGSMQSATTAFLVGAGLYGVHRATQKGIGRVLIAAPALVWMLTNFWRIVPEGAPQIERGPWKEAPLHLGTFIALGVYFATVALGRQKIGAGLAGLTMGALGFAAFATFLALFTDGDTSAYAVLHGTSLGWTHVALVLTAVCWLVLGLGPIEIPALPRSLGAIVGSVGAALLGAVISGAHGGGNPSTVRLWILLALFLAWVLAAFGPGALARAGAGPVAWVGVALIVVQILFGLPGAAFLADATGYGGGAGGMPITGVPFGLLGLALTALAARSIALDTPRNLTAVLLLVGVLGAMQLWFTYLLMALRVFRRSAPGWPVELLSRPAMILGLVLWAACLAFLASPPRRAP